MSDSANARLSPDDALPRVEPPTGTFIVQLFVVPAIIVTLIVLVWVLFNWLAHMGSDPHQYLEQIRKQNANSWIAAHNLAEELRTKPALREDKEVARDLGAMLTESIEAGRFSEDDVQLRVFLCRALGEFTVADGLPALIKAAETHRRAEDLDVQRSALEAMALLVSHVRENASSTSGVNDSELLPTLLAASRDDKPVMREGAAYALGVLGGDTAESRLDEMLSDTQPNVRFNAATGLARHGRPESLEVLLEMLDVANLKGVAEELDVENVQRMSEEDRARAQDFKRALITINGLRAAKQLVDAQADLDTSGLKRAVDDLVAADLKETFAQPDYAVEVHAHAQTLQKHLQTR